MSRSRIFIIGLCLLIAASVAADNDAGRESPFSFGAGGRSLGLGGSFTAISNDASAVFYNPAGLSRQLYQNLTLLHASLFEGTIYDFAAWAYPISPDDGIGVSFSRIGTQDIKRVEDFIETGDFNYSSSQAVFAYGRRFSRFFSLGFSFKAVNQSFDDLSDWAIGADVGALVRPSPILSFGFIARDLMQPELKLDTVSESVPRSFVVAAALEQVRIANDIAVTLTGDFEKYTDRDIKIRAGGEVLFLGRYAIRAGFDRDNLALGAGAKIGPVHVDYAYKIIDYVDNSHRFALTFDIGAPTSERFQPPEPILVPVEPRPEQLTPEQRRFNELRETASEFFRQLELDSALYYYQQALQYEPDNAQIKQTIASIQKDLEQRRERQRQLEMAEGEIEQFVNRYLSQAQTFANKNYYLAALDLLELVLDMDPDNEVATNLKADIQNKIQTEVNRNLEKARLARQEGRALDAVEAYNRILELSPDADSIAAERRKLLSGLDVAQQLNLGIEHFNQQRYQQARQRLEAVLRLDPGNTVAKEYLQRIDNAEKQPSTLEDLQKNREIWNLYLEGIRHMRNQQYQQAIDAWQKVLEVFPDNEETRNNIEQARLRLQSEQSN